MPAKPTGGGPRLTFIPSKGALHGPEVVDLGLDLDHEKDPSPWVTGQDVDPASGSIPSDLHLGGGQPAGPLQASDDLIRAMNVGRIALSLAIAKEWAICVDHEFGPHRLGQPGERRHADVSHTTALDRRDECLRSVPPSGGNLSKAPDLR